MVDRISDWASTITITVIVAALIGALLPEGSFQRFGRFITGLMIIAVVVQPFVGYLGSSWEFERALVSYREPEPFTEAVAWEGQRGYYAQDLLDRAEASTQRQMSAIVSLIPGVSETSVEVSYGRDGRLGGVKIDLIGSGATSTSYGDGEGAAEGGSALTDKVRRIVAGVYGIDESLVMVNMTQR